MNTIEYRWRKYKSAYLSTLPDPQLNRIITELAEKAFFSGAAMMLIMLKQGADIEEMMEEVESTD